MRKLKIMVVAGLLPPKVSGAGKRALRTALEISKHHNVTLISRTRNEALGIPNIVIFPELTVPKGQPGRTVNNLINLSLLPIAVFFQLLKVKNKPDILHIYSINWFSIFVILFNLVKWRSRIFTEITLMGSDTINSSSRWWLYLKLTNFFIRKSNHINCISPQLYDYMKEHGITEQKMSIIPNSLDEKYFNRNFDNKTVLRNKLGFNSDDFIISTVGGITKRKGYLFIQEILKKIPPSYHIKIIAVGSYELDNQKRLVSEIHSNLENAGMIDRIVFVGYTDPLPYLLLSDMFLFVSTREGFGSAIIEAMACGLPVLVKKIEKVTEYILTNKQTGIVIDTDNPVDFADQITALYSGQNHQTLGEKARKDVIKRFSINVIVEKYLSVYNNLLLKK